MPTTNVRNLIKRLLSSEMDELDMVQAFRLVREHGIPAAEAYVLVTEDDDNVDEIIQAMQEAGYAPEEILQAIFTDKKTVFESALECAILCSLPLDTLPEVLVQSGRALPTREATVLIKALLAAGKSPLFIARCLLQYKDTLDTLHQQMTFGCIEQPDKYAIIYDLLQLRNAEMRSTQKIEG